ncbi:methionyl-tRNA formyltransferase [Terasakiella sp.]|uniref:methionyl-tRNA formyltransferase n=1 Tax=Terasakiella sp. TaxID=2034861 RepID=UPI003AA89ADE
MRIVFIGASKFGLRSLERLVALNDVELIGVVTAPESFPISYNLKGVKNVLYADVPSYCTQNDIAYEVISNGMKDINLYDRVVSWKPDVFIVVGWYHMLPQSWLDIAPTYGMHASLLPDYSGGAPLVWAMINGEEKTGISFFQFADGVDNGPIVAQVETKILPKDTIATLYDRIEELGLDLLTTYVPLLRTGEVRLIIQNEANRRIMPQRTPSDGLIDWAQEALVIDRFIRAQTRPYPGAFTYYDGKKVHIWSAKPVITEVTERSGFLSHQKDGNVWVFCKDGPIELEVISFEGTNYTGKEISRLFDHGGFLISEEAV